MAGRGDSSVTCSLPPTTPLCHDRFWFPRSPRGQGWHFTAAPRATLPLFFRRPSSRLCTRGADCLSFLLKKQRRYKNTVFWQNSTSLGRERKGRCGDASIGLQPILEASTLASMTAPPPPVTTEISEMVSSWAAGGTLGPAQACHLPSHRREDLGPERMADIPKVTKQADGAGPGRKHLLGSVRAGRLYIHKTGLSTCF